MHDKPKVQTLLFLIRTSYLCFKYTFVEKRSRVTICTQLYLTCKHVNMQTCFSYTYVAIIRLDIGP